MSEHRIGLCNRCEWRARHIEAGHGPRCECQDIGKSVYSCYMYKPVMPVVLEKNEQDKRPMFGSYMLSARSHGRLPSELEVEINVKQVTKKEWVLYWVAKERPKRNRKR